MKRKTIAFLIALFVPVWVCLLFRIFPLGSVGPVVPLTFLVDAILLPALIVWIAADIKSPRARDAIRVLAVPVGILLAYAQFVSYMPLTALFGLNDFDWI